MNRWNSYWNNTSSRKSGNIGTQPNSALCTYSCKITMKTQLFEAAPSKSARGTLILFPVCAILKSLDQSCNKPFLAAASFLSFRSFSSPRRMSIILFVSACFFRTSDRTLSAAAFSSRSWERKEKNSDEMCEISLKDKNQMVFFWN